MARPRLGEILVNAKVIDSDKLKLALAEQRNTGAPLGRILVDLNFISEDILLKALSHQLNIPVVDVRKMTIPRDVLDFVAADVARSQLVLPFQRDASFLHVAMADPSNVGLTDELRVKTGLVIQAYLAGPEALQAAIRQHYAPGSSLRPQPAPASGRSRRSVRMPSVGLGDAAVSQADMAALQARLSACEQEMEALKTRLGMLEQLRARDESALKQVCLLLVEKNLATREEIVARMNRST